MKGIILAAGKGSRLYPMTRPVCKPLLPVYDKPMIYYPLAVLLEAGIRGILIIIPPGEEGPFYRLLGSGGRLGVNITYEVQEVARGIADALLIGSQFIGNDDVCLVLGDNIFYSPKFGGYLKQALQHREGACVFGYYVDDPERFGVVEFDENGKAVSVEEKPAAPKSNYAITGLYFYDKKVCQRAKMLKPSARGELEITDLNRIYLEEGSLNVITLGRGYAWLDTGTVDSLSEASEFVRVIETREGVQISAPEEIAFRNGWITKEKLEESADLYGKSPYGKHLRNVAQGKYMY